MSLEEIIDKGTEGEGISREEAERLLKGVALNSKEMFLMMHAADSLSRDHFADRGEIHAQIGLNWGSCSKNCDFCAFGEKHGLIDGSKKLSQEEVQGRAIDFGKAGANAIFLMPTADYEFERLLHIGEAVRSVIDDRMPLVANVGDFSSSEAHDLIDAGFTAIYHVLRLREGEDTEIDPEERKETIRVARSAGLDSQASVLNP